jgi:tRNA threonylcarbamoyl adenosine modification protein YjeE
VYKEANTLSLSSTLCLHADQISAWASCLATLLEPGDWIFLEGDLGSGKTTLVRAISRALGQTEENAATSPTFPIVQCTEFPAPPHVGRCLHISRLLHIDLYRTKHPSEIYYFGLDELFVPTTTLVCVEWPYHNQDMDDWKMFFRDTQCPLPTRLFQLDIEYEGGARSYRLTRHFV